MYERTFAMLVYICLTLMFLGCSLVTQEPIEDNPPTDIPTPSSTMEVGIPSNVASPKTTEKPVPTITPSPTVDPVMLLLDSMTVDEKLGQLLIVGYNNDEQAKNMIKNHKVGGMVLYSRNYRSFEELYLLTQQLKEDNQENSFPLWLAMDEEGGSVTRLPPGKTPIPDAR